MSDTIFTVSNLENPKSSQGIFDLPCGFVDADGVVHTEVKVREMTGSEEDLLTSKSTPFHKKMNDLLSRCVDRIGTITERSKIVAAIPELTIGDQTFLIFAIRRVSLGEEYFFTDKCAECKKESTHSMMLGDLDVKPMEDPTKRVFDTALPSGKAVRFKTLLVKDQDKMAKLVKVDDPLSMAIAIRVESINGSPITMADVKTLNLKDRNYLREQFDKSDGGVDTDVEVTCPECGADYSTSLDVGQVGFFFPSAMKKTSKKRSSI